MDLGNKVCVVTGASSGIGRRTALEMGARGALVCVAARRADRLQDLVDELGGEERGHSYVSVDVTDRDQVRALADHVEQRYARCDVLLNSAGISRGRGFRGVDSFDDLDAVMATNFFGAVNCTAYLLPLLQRAAPSSVVNVASVAGRLTFAGASAYCASKFALVGWSECVRYDLERRGIYVTSIEPGPVPTEGFPQRPLVSGGLLRLALTSEENVARAIVAAIGRRKVQRVIPRWYYLLRIPRLLAPPFYRRASRAIMSGRVRAEEDPTA